MTITTAILIDVEGLDPEVVEEIRDAAAAIIARTSDTVPDPDAVRGWTPALVDAFDARLRRRGRWVQADTIAAAARAGGRVSRETVYEIGGYDRARSLNGFTKPVAGVMRDMVREGLLPADAANPMKPVYDASNAANQKALGFTMPAEVAEVFRRDEQ